MTAWVILFLVIVFVVAIITVILIRDRRDKDKTKPSDPPTGTPMPGSASEALTSLRVRKTAGRDASAGAVVVYESGPDNAKMVCAYCGCAYEASAKTCEICDSKLQRRKINDM